MKRGKVLIIIGILLLLIAIPILISNYYFIYGRICYSSEDYDGLILVIEKMGKTRNEKYIPFLLDLLYEDTGKLSGTIYNALPQFESKPAIKALLMKSKEYAKEYGGFSEKFSISFKQFAGNMRTEYINLKLFQKHQDYKYNNDYKPLEKIQIYEEWFKENLDYLKRVERSDAGLEIVGGEDPDSPMVTEYWEVDIYSKVCYIPYKQWKEYSEERKLVLLSENIGKNTKSLRKLSEPEIEEEIRKILEKRGLDPIRYVYSYDT